MYTIYNLMETNIHMCVLHLLLFSFFTAQVDSINIYNTQGSCLSWRLAVETDNLRRWTPPLWCLEYVISYMLGHQYQKDSNAAVYAALTFAQSEVATATRGGTGIWVFDIDETALSNLPLYSSPDVDFGRKPYNESLFDEWVEKAAAPVLPATLYLYKKLISMGFKVVFLTGRTEDQRQATTTNLIIQGYFSWLKLILREKGEEGTKAIEYKSSKRESLEKEGYKIIGNVGDQWSDLLGSNTSLRSFKLPNPMYYIG